MLVDCSSAEIGDQILSPLHYHSIVMGASYLDLSGWPRTPANCELAFSISEPSPSLSSCSFSTEAFEKIKVVCTDTNLKDTSGIFTISAINALNGESKHVT